MTSFEHGRLVFEAMKNAHIGTSFVSSVLNNPYTTRTKIETGKAEYVSRSPKSGCVIGFTVDEQAPISARDYIPPTDANKRYHMEHGLANGQPAWIGEVTGAIVSWRYISDPSLCLADFSGK